MKGQTQHFLNWIQTKLIKEFAFIEGPEHHRAEEELSALPYDDREELNKWIEKYLTDKQIKSMKAAYRKSKSRNKNKNYLTRTTDAIELDYDRSCQLSDLAKYNKLNKREYIKRLIDMEYEAMLVKSRKDREDAELEIFHMLSKYRQVHLKVLSCFPETLDKPLETLAWLTTQNTQLQNYSPKRFLAKQNGEKQVLALLETMKEDLDVVT